MLLAVVRQTARPLLSRTMSSSSSSWLSAAQRTEAEALVAYINASPSPFHAVEASKAMLVEAGFAPLSERAEWNVQPNGKYFVTRNNSTIVAFAVGGKWVRDVTARTHRPLAKPCTSDRRRAMRPP